MDNNGLRIKLEIRTLQRFFNRIHYEIFSGCWEWVAEKQLGYGMFTYKGKQWRAHRFSYALFKEELKNDLEIDHLCNNPCCVNPNHLEQVTRKENMKRVVERRKNNFQFKRDKLITQRILNAQFLPDKVIV